MGVDYSSNWGIGIEIIKSDVINAIDEDVLKNKYESCWIEVLDEIEYHDDFKNRYRVIRFGDAYSGEDRFAIVLQNPFKDGYDITPKIEEFKRDLKGLGFDNIGEIKEVGGLGIS